MAEETICWDFKGGRTKADKGSDNKTKLNGCSVEYVTKQYPFVVIYILPTYINAGLYNLNPIGG